MTSYAGPKMRESTESLDSSISGVHAFNNHPLRLDPMALRFQTFVDRYSKETKTTTFHKINHLMAKKSMVLTKTPF